MPPASGISKSKSKTVKNGKNKNVKSKSKHVQFASSPNEDDMPLLATIVPFVFQVLHTIKLAHWNTKVYSLHKATDELFASLNERFDQLVEVLLGKAGVERSALLANEMTIELKVLPDASSLKRFIGETIEVMLNWSKDDSFNTLVNTDVLAIRDEIVAKLNQTLYLLSLTL
jgi:hypothetical protein